MGKDLVLRPLAAKRSGFSDNNLDQFLLETYIVLLETFIFGYAPRLFKLIIGQYVLVRVWFMKLTLTSLMFPQGRRGPAGRAASCPRHA